MADFFDSGIEITHDTRRTDTNEENVIADPLHHGNPADRNKRIQQQNRMMFGQLFLAMICLMAATLAFAVAIIPGLTSNLPLGYKPNIVFFIVGCMCTGLVGIFTWVYVETINSN